MCVPRHSALRIKAFYSSVLSNGNDSIFQNFIQTDYALTHTRLST